MEGPEPLPAPASGGSGWRDRICTSVPAAVTLATVSFALMATWLLWLYVRRDGWPQRTPALAFAAVLYGVAAAGVWWLARVPGAEGGGEPPGPASIGGGASIAASARARPVAAAALLVAVALSVTGGFAQWARGDLDPTYWDLFVLWLATIALYVAPLGGPYRRRPDLAAIARRLRRSTAARDALLLTAAALVLRATLVGRWPDILGGDEGLSGGVARSMVERVGNPFSTTFAYGNLYHLVLAAFVRWLGPTVTALRLPNALAGAAAVGVTCLAGHQLFGRRVGLAAGALLLTSHMHVHMSRTAHGQAFDTLVSAAAVFALARGMSRRSQVWMAMAGVAFGLGQFFYVGGRAVDVVAVLFAVLLAVFARDALRRHWAGLCLAAGATLVTAMPMIVWAVRRPEDYLTRLNATGLVQSGALADRLAGGAPSWQVLLGQVARAVVVPLAYPATSFYDAALPMLDLLTGTLLVLGVFWAVNRLRDWRYLLLLAGLATAVLVLTLGNLVTTSAYRVTGAMPFLVLLAAAALASLLGRSLQAARVPEAGRDAVMLAAIGLIAGYNLGYTFLVQLPGCRYLGGDVPTAAVSASAGHLARTAPHGTILALTLPTFDYGTFPNGAYLLGRKTRSIGQPLTDDRSGQTSTDFVWSVPQGYDLESLATHVESSPHPVAIIASTVRLPDLDALASRLPGGSRASFHRCGRNHLADVYVLP